MTRPAEAVPGYPPPADPEPIDDLPQSVLDAFTAFTFAKSDGEREAAVRVLSAHETTLPPGQQAFFRVKTYSVLATPFLVRLEQQIAKGSPPRDPNAIAVGLIDGFHQAFAAKEYGQSGEWLVRAVPVEETFRALRGFYEVNLQRVRERNEGERGTRRGLLRRR
jgi:hypothetical protein